VKSLADIQADVLRLAEQHGIADKDLPTFGRSRDGGYPHIEVGAGTYHYVNVERGEEISRLSTREYDELLYWVCADLTHGMAFAFELRHRVAGRDSRRMAFERQLDLLVRISPAMADRRAEEIGEILVKSPYVDRGA